MIGFSPSEVYNSTLWEMQWATHGWVRANSSGEEDKGLADGEFAELSALLDSRT